MSVPATNKQLTYIDALIRRVTKLLPKGSEIALELRGAALGPLTKAEASKFIQALLATEDRLLPHGEVTVRRVEERGPDPVALLETVLASDRDIPVPEEEPFDEEAAFQEMLRDSRRAREQEERDAQLRALAYNQEQRRQFGGKVERPAPEGQGKYLRVWKRVPNSLSEGWHEGVVYGWAWECSHPSHGINSGGRQKVVRGGSYTEGQAGSLKAALAHWKKYHAG